MGFFNGERWEKGERRRGRGIEKKGKESIGVLWRGEGRKRERKEGEIKLNIEMQMENIQLFFLSNFNFCRKKFDKRSVVLLVIYVCCIEVRILGFVF